jgi:hypothetical protein
VFVDDAAILLVDVEITGASRAGVEFGGPRTASLLGSRIHDNPGVAVMINRSAAPRIAHNTFHRNRTAIETDHPGAEEGPSPSLHDNVFVGLGSDAVAAMERTTRLSLSGHNWFIPPPPPVRTPRPPTPRTERRP